MKSIRARMLMLLAAFGVLIAATLVGITYQAVTGFYMDVQYERASAFAKRIVSMHPDLWTRYRDRPARFSSVLSEYILYSPDTGLYLLDRDGRVLASAGEPRIFWSNFRVDVEKLAGSLASNPDAPIMGADPDSKDATCLVAAHPVYDRDEIRGWLYVVPRGHVLGGQNLELFRSYATRAGLKVGLITVAVGVLLTLAVMALLTRPLTALTRVVERVKRSGLGTDLDGAQFADVCESEFPYCGRSDEIGRLSLAFRDMLVRLKQEMQRVTVADARRREMVASVSHDLRTPLTALLGQLETIRMKGQGLDRAELEKFHDRALQNAQHLRHLTDALAELAKLDNPEFRAQPEPMAIGELADDIVQRFVGRAETGGIRLVVDYPDGLPLTAVDAALIDRALSNLLDNALRVTPTGGLVRVAVVRDGDGLRVEVHDSGPGVAAADQARVFDVFYQASRHRETRGSSGLGLAIVRRVAELHGGSAGLSSEPGRGATFFIHLPVGAIA